MNTKTFKWLSVINAILILLSFAGCGYVLTNGNGAYYVVAALAEMLSLVFSFLYYVQGYKKNAALYYRLCMLFFAVTYLAESLVYAYAIHGTETGNALPISMIVTMILYGNTFLLALGKDLGKKVSYTLCLISVFAYLLFFIGSFIPSLAPYEADAAASIKASDIILNGAWLVLALNGWIMTMAKYADKASRGSK